MNVKDQLAAKIEKSEAVVCIIGLGYVGLPLLVEFARSGFHAIGLDIDARKVEELMAGRSYFLHIPAEPIAEAVESGRLEATSDFSRVSDADVVIICVPTPLNEHREPDLTFVTSTTKDLAPYLHHGQLIILESTTYPGTTDGVIRELLEQKDLQLDRDFFLAFSPEREDPGNREYTLGRIPKVVGGVTPDSTELAVHLYSMIVDQVVPVPTAATAEAVKLTENIFRAVNIALVNELKMIYQSMGIDVWEVIRAAATKPFGYMPFYPGPGLGGHCIPIDPFYLSWQAKKFGINTRFIELAGEINANMPGYVIDRLGEALNEHEKCFKNSRILILGMAYKRDIDDIRESPALILYELLLARGAVLDYYDPYIPIIPRTRKHAQLEGVTSIQWDENKLSEYDAVLIITDHTCVDYAAVVREAKLVVDTRNATADVTEGREKIYRA